MSKRLRLTLALIGLALLCFAALALAYALWPTTGLSEQTPLAPTLFAPP